MILLYKAYIMAHCVRDHLKEKRSKSNPKGTCVLSPEANWIAYVSLILTPIETVHFQIIGSVCQRTSLKGGSIYSRPDILLFRSWIKALICGTICSSLQNKRLLLLRRQVYDWNGLSASRTKKVA